MNPLHRAQSAYNHVDDGIKEDLGSALDWARKTLTEREGGGHLFHILPEDGEFVMCCFAKPEWGGDHCSQPMEDGAKAIVMAVCEYLNGV